MIHWDSLRFLDAMLTLTFLRPTDVMPSTRALGNDEPRSATAVAVPWCSCELWPRPARCATPGSRRASGRVTPLSVSWASVIPGETEADLSKSASAVPAAALG